MQIASEEAVVRKSVRVEVPIERAFSVFVEQMESLVAGQPSYRRTAFETIIVEPRVGGRWYERNVKGEQCDWGTVLAWDAPHHVAFSWHVGPGRESPEWGYDADPARASRVDVRLRLRVQGWTLVELVHSGLERHGEGYEQLRAAFDSPNAWSGVLAHYAAAVNAKEAR